MSFFSPCSGIFEGNRHHVSSSHYSGEHTVCHGNRGTSHNFAQFCYLSSRNDSIGTLWIGKRSILNCHQGCHLAVLPAKSWNGRKKFQCRTRMHSPRRAYCDAPLCGSTSRGNVWWFLCHGFGSQKGKNTKSMTVALWICKKKETPVTPTPYLIIIRASS